MIRPQLIIFVKAPLIGKAKTRLAADIGRVQSWRIFPSMTAKLLRDLRSESWDISLAVTPAQWRGKMPLWVGFHQYPQTSGSLSPRLAQAFSTKGPIVVIGSDCPEVKKSDIRNAIRQVRRGKVVFGPARDGGFWLMAAQGPLAHQRFENIRWSSEHTLADMEKNMPQKIIKLRMLTDIDDLEALKLYGKI